MSQINMVIDAVVEIPGNTSYKYEICKSTGELILDRVVPINVPFNYGYVPHTLCEDGDPLDVFIVSKDQIFPKARCKVEIVGVFKCKDNGHSDDKLVGVLVGENIGSEIEQAKALIDYYLRNYKKGFEVIEYRDEVAATKEVISSSSRFECEEFLS